MSIRRIVLVKVAKLIVLFLLSSCSVAGDSEIKTPAVDTQRLVSGNLDWNIESFMKAYRSKDVSQRRLAEMYLIGALDATEGVSWCGYGIASPGPGAIQEQAFLGLKKVVKSSPEMRASIAIISRFNE